MSHDPAGFDALVRPHADAVLDLIGVHEDALERRWVTPSADAPVLGQIAEQRRFAMPGASTPIDQAITLGVQYTIAGCDHARSICTLVTAEPAVIYSDKILLRSAVEAMARGAWLLAPTIPAGERCRRLANELLHARTRTLSAAKRVDRDEGTDRAAELGQRRDELAAAAIAHGLGEIGRSRYDVWVGKPRPTATKVIAQLLDEDKDPESDLGPTLQGFYSEFVHSNIGALHYQLVTDDLPGTPPTGDIISAPLASSAHDVQMTLQFAATALLIAATEMRTLLGWRDVEWADAIRRSWPVLRKIGGGESESTGRLTQ